jgi:hypothetical protein
MGKPILCLDFDGVLHSYSSGWKGAVNIPDPPVAKMVPFLERAIAEFDVQVFSSRSNQEGGVDAMKAWLAMHVTRHFDCEFHGGAPHEAARAYAILDAISYPTEKPPAMVTIDDRAIQFDGTWPAIAWLKAFQPWYKRPFGATGNFPMPAVDDDDEGGLRMGVAFDPVNELVRLDFGKPVAWLALPPPEAIELAKLLMRKSGVKKIEIEV